MENYPIAKIIQKFLYDYFGARLSVCHRVSLILCVVLMIAWLVDMLGAHCRVENHCTNNLLGAALPEHICPEQPIDVVYTWVNGCDPALQRQLKETRARLRRPTAGWRRHCPLQLCLTAALVTVVPRLPHRLPLRDVKFFIHGADPVDRRDSPHPELSSSLLLYKSVEDARRVLLTPYIRINDDNYTLYQTFWVSAASFASAPPSVRSSISVPDDRHVMGWGKGFDSSLIPPEVEVVSHAGSVQVLKLPDTATVARVLEAPGLHLNITFLSNFVGSTHSDGSNDRDSIDRGANDVNLDPPRHSNSSVTHKSDGRIYRVRLVLQLAEVDEAAVDARRFEDNEELRYSLRSLERYAPWVRHVYLVTNGQIPDWLSLDAQRLTVVTHEEISPDLSHLPTFSSPAIECHLHRIPGLSQRFLYFNDDVLLGSPVWPDDFYTQSEGYSVYLAWLLPDCAQGCSHYWLKDGRCDVACNNAACGWDAGDCGDGSATETPSASSSINPEKGRTVAPLVAQHDDNDYPAFAALPDPCLPDCQDTWLGDGFCDTGCDALDCGFDLGDCGTALYRELHSFGQLRHDSDYLLPARTPAVFWNVTSLQAHFRLGSVAFPRLRAVRGLVLNQRLGIVTLLRRTDTSLYHLPVYITGVEVAGGDSRPKTEQLISFHLRSGDAGIDSGIDKVDVHPNITDNTSNVNFASGGVVSESSAVRSSWGIFRRRAAFHVNRTQSTLGGNGKTASPRVSLLQRRLMSFNPIGNASQHIITTGYDIPSPDSADSLDTYGASLLHVNQLYTLRYGAEHRRTVAHMPHILERDIIRALHSTFPAEFARTSAGRLRSRTDMQFAFAYFYFLMSERRRRSAAEVFEDIDTDGSGTWSDREIRTLAARLRPTPLTRHDLESVWALLKRCADKVPRDAQVSTPPGERYPDSDLPTISRAAVLSCAQAVAELEQTLGKEKSRYRHRVVLSDDVVFTRVQGNASRLVATLDDIRRYPRKFLCFNNDISAKDDREEVELMRALLVDFFESTLPTRSQFELPPTLRNRFGTVAELESWRWQRTMLRAASATLMLLLLWLLFYDQVEFKLRAWRLARIKRRHRSAHHV